MTKPTRSIAADILEGLNEAIDYLDGKPTGVRVTQVAVVPKCAGHPAGDGADAGGVRGALCAAYRHVAEVGAG